jgi:hypothetical protein
MPLLSDASMQHAYLVVKQANGKHLSLQRLAHISWARYGRSCTQSSCFIPTG